MSEPAATTKCQAVLVIGDDYGDNVCTFTCQLEEGHAGNHREVTRRPSEDMFEMAWNYDCREPCHDCGKLTHPNRLRCGYLYKDCESCELHAQVCNACPVCAAKRRQAEQAEEEKHGNDDH